MPAAAGPVPGHPVRSCRVCRARRPKAQLTRWVWRAGWIQDAVQVLAGRGAYTCSPACATKLVNLRPRRSGAK